MRLSGREALQCLREGNERFRAGLLSLDSLSSHVRRRERAESQDPIAIVLGCSDSRAPAEMIFDCGLGDLFVIRVAGNIAAPSQIASIEFAAATFGTRLVVVLGHSGCGAVAATLDCLTETTSCTPALHAIVDRIKPAVEPLLHAPGMEQPTTLMEAAVHANLFAAIEQIRRGSSILEAMMDRGELLIVGAKYSLESGQVEFFDDGVTAMFDGHRELPESAIMRRMEIPAGIEPIADRGKIPNGVHRVVDMQAARSMDCKLSK